MASNNFRDYIPGPDFPRTQGASERDAYSHAEHSLSVPFIQEFVAGWRRLYAEPFKGITTDGCVQPGLFRLEPEGAPTERMVAAARALLAIADEAQRRALGHAIDAPEWRLWSNPEFYINPVGLRLEEVSAPVREAILGVVRASLSERGYRKARDCMRMNAFLGEVVNAPAIMNEYSYNFSLFGEPSTTEPWGWQLFGHHLVLNCLVLGGQMVVSPTFMGAEPNGIDAGPYKGLSLFQDEEREGLALMQSLPQDVQRRAQVYKLMNDPAMPPGRWHRADQRHLGAAFQDNRVIPYEGVAVEAFDAGQKLRLLDIVEQFVCYLPPGPLAARLSAVETHLDETRFCWIGGYGDEDPFYYRIQSPVVMVEFDHHSGVWLTNAEPAKCHTHTVVRTPNGNDYGKDLLRQHYEHAHPGRKIAGHQ
jgi:hypothetical protein